MVSKNILLEDLNQFHGTNLGISCYENSVDPDQLASEKPADQDLHFFHSACKFVLVINWGSAS